MITLAKIILDTEITIDYTPTKIFCVIMAILILFYFILKPSVDAKNAEKNRNNQAS